MIRADISNLWCSVSLPELLGNERKLFDTHMALAGGEYRQNGFFGWLSQSGSVRRAWLAEITAAAEAIRAQSEVLVVVGGGLSIAGARAAIRLSYGRRVSTPRLIYVGDSFSAEDWLDVPAALEGRDFSVLVCGTTGNELPMLTILRALYRILESRYGDQLGDRVFAFAPEGQNALRKLAQSEQFHLLGHPSDPAGVRSALSPAGLTLMAAAGMNADLLFGGAADCLQFCDARNLDNPAWLCAAAAMALTEKGVRDQFLCVPSPASAELGAWWARTATCWSRDGKGLRTASLRLPADLAAVGDLLLDSADAHYATILRLPPERRRASVEAMWKNEDGLKDLTGTDFGTLGDGMLDAVQDALTENDVPFVTVECLEPMTDDKIGELLYFAEFTSALTAQSLGLSPILHPEGWRLLEKPFGG
ncbi:MAG: hypothetical protein IJD20_06875 [Oscillospiraceae bacterium]|nr:hypothetical protein [Oscillospiraceae bacterium]